MSLKNLVKAIGNSADKHKGTILTIISVGSTVYALYRAVKDAPRYKEILDQANEEGASSTEKVKRLAPVAAPMIISAAVSIGSQIGMHKVATDAVNGLAAMQTLYNGVAAAKDEYVAATEKVVGPEKTKEIREAIAKEHAPSYDGSGYADRIYVTGHGNDVFYDAWSGRYFYSDVNYVKKCINDINYQLMNDMFVSLNEFYGYLDLPPIDAGRNTGWNTDHGQIDIDITASLDENDKPYTVISFRREPMNTGNGRYW